jgi:hypothetical protein
MMEIRTIKSIAAASLTAFALASCDSQTEWTTFNETYEQTLEQTDSADISVKHVVDYYKSLSAGKSARNKANNAIVEFCFGDANAKAGMSVEEASEADADSIMAAYQTDAGEVYESLLKDVADGYCDENDIYYDVRWYDNTEGHFGDTYGDFQNYNVLSECYLGGAHGMYGIRTHIIDLKTGLAVTENAIFKPGYVQPVSDLIKEAMQKKYGSEGDPESQYSGMFHEYMLPNGNCGVSAEGVFWNYNPYEVASYSEGIITVMVPWEALKPYINPEVISL